jgi:hypothetical protein
MDFSTKKKMIYKIFSTAEKAQCPAGEFPGVPQGISFVE